MGWLDFGGVVADMLKRFSPARGGGGRDALPSALPIISTPSGTGTAPACGIGGPSYCGHCVVLVGLSGVYVDAVVPVGAGYAGAPGRAAGYVVVAEMGVVGASVLILVGE